MENTSSFKIQKNWKFYLGISLCIYSFIPYIVSGMLLFFKIPLGNLMALIGVFLTSAEVAFAISVILLGKPFIKMLKSKFKGWFIREKAAVPAKPIGKFRHYLGIVLLLSSFLPDIAVQVSLFLGYPKSAYGEGVALIAMLAGTTMFIAGLIILGPDFWERLMKLLKWPGPRESSTPA
jgi:hypothetical protein